MWEVLVTKTQKAKRQKKEYFVETNRIRGILIQRVLEDKETQPDLLRKLPFFEHTDFVQTQDISTERRSI